MKKSHIPVAFVRQKTKNTDFQIEKIFLEKKDIYNFQRKLLTKERDPNV